MRPSRRMRLRAITPLRETIRDELRRRERAVVVPPERPEPPPPTTSPPSETRSEANVRRATQPSTETLAREHVATVRTLDAVELLSTRRSELTEALDRVRTATRERPIEAQMQRRLAELRAIPQTPPDAVAQGWIAVRIVGASPADRRTVPLPGITVELRTEGEEEPSRAITDPLGVALLKLKARGLTGANLHVVSPRGQSVVSRSLTGSSGQSGLVLEAPYDDSLEAIFAAGQRFYAAVEAAEAEAQRLEKRLAAERAADEKVFEADLGAVERTLRTVVDGRGGGE